jgi:hypothetical protein
MLYKKKVKKGKRREKRKRVEKFNFCRKGNVDQSYISRSS